MQEGDASVHLPVAERQALIAFASRRSDRDAVRAGSRCWPLRLQRDGQGCLVPVCSFLVFIKILVVQE